MILAGLEGAWTFTRPATGGVETLDATFRVRGDQLEIAVPRLGSRGLVIRAVVAGEGLSGQFEMGSTTGTIDLRVRPDGRLVGNPTTFANRERWQFSR